MSSDDDTLHRLISGESHRRKIPLPRLARATLLAAANDELKIRSDHSLSSDWRDRLRHLAGVVELQRDWHWWQRPPWDELMLLRTNIAHYAAWLDREFTLASVQGTTVYRTGLPGKPSSWHLIEAEGRRRYAEGERHSGRVGESAAEWARVLIDWLKATHKDAPTPTGKTVANKLAPLLHELAAAPRPES
jgi:hypothetical protein